MTTLRALELSLCLLIIAAMGCTASLESIGADFTSSDASAMGPSWMQHVLSPEPQEKGYFGGGLALDGDQLFVVAPGQRVGNVADAGKVFRFERRTQGREHPIFEAAQAIALPNAISGQGTFNYNGLPERQLLISVVSNGGTLAVGVAGTGDHCDGAHPLVHVFERAGDANAQSYQETQRLIPDRPCKESRFGRQLLLLDDELFVSASSDDNATADNPDGVIVSGCVYVYRRRVDGKFELFQRLTMEPPEPRAFFGFAMAGDRDRVAISAAYVYDALAGKPVTQRSQVFVYRRGQGEYSKPTVLQSQSPSDIPDGFGWALALQGDTLAVSAPFDNSLVPSDPSDTNATWAGAVYVMQGNQVDYLKAIEPSSDSWFGFSLALLGDRLLVGETNASLASTSHETDDPAESRVRSSGRAYLFERAATDAAFHLRATLQAPAPREDGHFSNYIALSDSVAALSSPFESGRAGGMKAGAVDIVDLAELPPLDSSE